MTCRGSRRVRAFRVAMIVDASAASIYRRCRFRRPIATICRSVLVPGQEGALIMKTRALNMPRRCCPAAPLGL